jgi:signal transduction histidine kinase
VIVDGERLANSIQVTGQTVSDVDLRTILDAWNEATSRLQATHELLRAEVSRLTDELEVKNRELARRNRLADLGQMSSHVAHEVRNGLVPIRLYAGLLRRKTLDNLALTDLHHQMASGITALETVVNDLLQFAADRRPARRRLDATNILREVAEQLAPQCAAQGIVCEVGNDSAPCEADGDMLRRACLNLALNALDVMPQGGSLRLEAVAADDGCEVRICDSGPGISDDLRARIFEPFFTTKNTGTGLGLAIVSHIIELHGGGVAIEDNHPCGSVFRLIIPNITVGMQVHERAA